MMHDVRADVVRVGEKIDRRKARRQRKRLEFAIGCEYWDNRYARLPYVSGRHIQPSRMKDWEKCRHWVEAAIRVVGRHADAR